MIIIGLTGNYGMGKSTVAKMFRELGAVVIDADDIVRQLLSDYAVIYEIKKVFGDDIIQQSEINKKKLAEIIFEHPHLRISLENILHPMVFKRIDEEIAKITDPSAIVIIEAPVIFERGYQNRFDKIITVYTSEDTAIERLKKKGVLEDDIRKRLKSQFPIEMKIKRSDFTIDNTRDIENTRKQVEEIYSKL
ncbi:dephospho-CoA kinase [Dissulfurispira thermophila]|uniref:Dephospho-CoA kinase n=1 Tax=Dissulfurispira thermophila TaxID=2715679 RepID=A0A7G1H1G8_9BACT|nr:dephospho-CoA kinase [Dissulfurispira thermophila]BCB96634.1 dephospho-CoA kinase [Dissulfurispira thermophila]